MKINGWDTLEAHAKQHRVEYGNHSMKNESVWIAGSPAPVFLKNEIGFKQIAVTLILKESKMEAVSDTSTILARLLDPVEIELEGNGHKFFGILSKNSVKEIVANRWYNLVLTFDCYEYGDEMSLPFSGQTEITVENPGNILTPVTVEVTPQIGAASVVLTGLCRDAVTGEDLPVKISDLETGKTVIIDGETGLVTQDGKLKENVEFWGIPALLPGENKITVDSNRMDVTVRFRPRYM